MGKLFGKGRGGFENFARFHSDAGELGAIHIMFTIMSVTLQKRNRVLKDNQKMHRQT